eukprot:scaffold1798_cov248-Pinguiococcus_pyrenoidosus.AAC.5
MSRGRQLCPRLHKQHSRNHTITYKHSIDLDNKRRLLGLATYLQVVKDGALQVVKHASPGRPIILRLCRLNGVLNLRLTQLQKLVAQLRLCGRADVQWLHIEIHATDVHFDASPGQRRPRNAQL